MCISCRLMTVIKVAVLGGEAARRSPGLSMVGKEGKCGQSHSQYLVCMLLLYTLLCLLDNYIIHYII